MSIRTHYDNLQVNKNASQAEIRLAYKKLIQRWHPDKSSTNKEKHEKITKIINHAYSVLSDPKSKSKHDSWIQKQKTKRPNNAVVNNSNINSSYEDMKNNDIKSVIKSIDVEIIHQKLGKVLAYLGITLFILIFIICLFIQELNSNSIKTSFGVALLLTAFIATPVYWIYLFSGAVIEELIGSDKVKKTLCVFLFAIISLGSYIAAYTYNEDGFIFGSFLLILMFSIFFLGIPSLLIISFMFKLKESRKNK